MTNAAIDGVFPIVVDKSAFIDTLKLGIWGERRPEPMGEIVGRENKPIGGKLSKYGRLDRGTFASTGNRYELVYGPRRKFLPLTMLALRSDQTLVTRENTIEVFNALCQGVKRVTVSQLELTFDLSGRSVKQLDQMIFTSARRFRTLEDEYGRQTFYIGAPTGRWQVRVYEKTTNITRLEFILRRTFLRQRRVSRVEDIDLLRYLDFADCVFLQKPNTYALKTISNDLSPERRRAFESLFTMLPLREFVVTAKDLFGVPNRDLVMPDALNDQVRRMQRKMIF